MSTRPSMQPLLVCILCAALGVNVPNCSVGVTPDLATRTGLKEGSRSFTAHGDRDQIRPEVVDIDEERDRVAELGPQIGDILRAHWAASG